MGATRISDLLGRIGHLLRSAERDAAARHGLLPTHLAALSYVARANRYSDTPLAAAEFLGATKGTVSQSLALLRRKGFVSAASDRVDRRQVRLGVTAKGAAVLRSCVPLPLLVGAVPPGTVSDRTPSELGAALTDLLVRLQRANASRSFGVCHTCRHFRTEGTTTFRCGLTAEPLSTADSGRICREHELVSASVPAT